MYSHKEKLYSNFLNKSNKNIWSIATLINKISCQNMRIAFASHVLGCFFPGNKKHNRNIQMQTTNKQK